MKENRTLELGRKMSVVPMSYSSDLLMMKNCGVIKYYAQLVAFICLLLFFSLFLLVFVLFFVCFVFYFVCLLSFVFVFFEAPY